MVTPKGKKYAGKSASRKTSEQLFTPEEARVWMLRILSFCWGLGAGIFTFRFSANGIAYFFTGEPWVVAFGYFMAFGVVFFQLYFYQGYTENKLFLGASVMAFVYSIWTTWAGLMGSGNININAVMEEPAKAAVILFFALLIDLTAEPALLFAFFGRDALHLADAVGAVWDMIIPGDQSNLYKKRKFTGFNFRKSRTKQPVTNQNQYQTNSPSVRELQQKLNGVRNE